MNRHVPILQCTFLHLSSNVTIVRDHYHLAQGHMTKSFSLVKVISLFDVVFYIQYARVIRYKHSLNLSCCFEQKKGIKIGVSTLFLPDVSFFQYGMRVNLWIQNHYWRILDEKTNNSCSNQQINSLSLEKKHC